MSGESEAEPKKEKDAKEEEPDKPSDWKDAILYVAQRASDAGYLPFTLVCLFFALLVYLLTRNLDSHDTLAFLERLTGSGWVWLGWVIALLEIPVGRWVLNRRTGDRDRQIARLQTEVTEARKRLKEQASKQPGLDLPLENGQKSEKLNPE